MATLKFPVDDTDHAQGPASAPVTLLEYGDYQCPYCGEAYAMVKQLQERFGDSVRLVFRNFPITESHPEAMGAAVFAEYAATHGKFWEAHDALYEHQDALGTAYYLATAKQLGLDVAGLDAALDGGGDIDKRIAHDFNGGVRSGVNGTPSFFIDGKRYDGSLDPQSLADALAAAGAA